MIEMLPVIPKTQRRKLPVCVKQRASLPFAKKFRVAIYNKVYVSRYRCMFPVSQISSVSSFSRFAIRFLGEEAACRFEDGVCAAGIVLGRDVCFHVG